MTIGATAGFRHIEPSLDNPRTLPAVRKRGFTLIEPFDADSVGAQGKLPVVR